MSDAILGSVAAILARPADSLTQLHGGRNSRVFKVLMQDGQCYVVKNYFQNPDDQRDRLGTEWRAFTFLHTHGLSCVPLPIACDAKQQLALYSWIEGKTPQLTPDHGATVSAFGDFWESLYALRAQGTALHLPPAADACFCFADLERHLQTRCVRLGQAPRDTPLHRDMHAFITKTLLPRQEACLQNARMLLRKAHIGAACVLPEQVRMPSPSDFGAHNALQDAHGRIFFVDFEYFGMDDPVKLLADTCLHPGMKLTGAQKVYLVERMSAIAATGGDKTFGTRFAALAPLWRCVWACIVLNAFVPRDDARRAFAQSAKTDETLLRQQLDKAKELAKKDYHEHESACPFPA